jgi:hypothetical protein
MIEVTGSPECASAPEYETPAGRTAKREALWSQIQGVGG